MVTERHKKKQTYSPWLQLVRPPNLLTVPGDPIAGYLLAAGAQSVVPLRIVLAVLAAFFLYVGGLIVNDLADLEHDRRERPNRPLPSGRVGGKSALAAAVVAFAAGIACFWSLGGIARLVGLALVFSILLYDLGAKSIPIIGAVNMGLCRGLSLLLGAAAAPGGEWLAPPATLAFDVIVLYIASVTHLAREEATAHRIGAERWTPAFVLAASFAVLARLYPVVETTPLLIFCGSFLLAGFLAIAVGETLDVTMPESREDLEFISAEDKEFVIPELIGMLLGAIVLIQAALVSIARAGDMSMLMGVTLLAAWPIHRILSRRFYSS